MSQTPPLLVRIVYLYTCIRILCPLIRFYNYGEEVPWLNRPHPTKSYFAAVPGKKPRRSAIDDDRPDLCTPTMSPLLDIFLTRLVFTDIPRSSGRCPLPQALTPTPQHQPTRRHFSHSPSCLPTPTRRHPPLLPLLPPLPSQFLTFFSRF